MYIYVTHNFIIFLMITIVYLLFRIFINVKFQPAIKSANNTAT